MKTLLFITAFPPNLKSGGQKFSLNLIKDLSHTFKIDLIYFSFPDHLCEINDYVNQISVYKPSYKNCLEHITCFPLFTKRFNKKVLSHIRTIAASYDIIFFDYSQTAVYSMFIAHPYKVIRCHDIIAQKIARQHPLLKFWACHSESEILRSATKIFVPSPKDSEIVHKTYKLTAISTNEYLTDFCPNSDTVLKNQFVFYGLWSRKENLEGLLWFIHYVYPFLQDDKKKSIVVMGGGLSLKIKNTYLDRHNIRYLGFVPNALNIIYESSALVVPLFSGAGIKVKLLDAFTTGTPVIGTDIAFEGLPDIKGLSYIANSAQDFSNKINNFLPLEINDKKKYRANFVIQYNKNHLTEYL
jgi:glycosyltransferase involved in cell wall biosynthesis